MSQPEILAAHAEFGGDLELMQKAYEWHDLKADNKRLRETLEWYGEQARLARLIHREGDAGRQALSDDGGNRAHYALVGTKAAKGGA